MTTKTITLELDAYEKLRAAKRSDRESFTSVVRRGTFVPGPHTGAAVLALLRNWAERPRAGTADALAYLERAHEADSTRPRISPSPWTAPETKGGG